MKNKKHIIILLFIFLLLIHPFKTQAKPLFNGGILYLLSSQEEAQMLSSIFVSKCGTVIVIDGGWTYDAEKLLTTIRQHGNRVDAWLITHPDPDHIGALYQILKSNEHIDIRNVYCSFDRDSWYLENSPDTYNFVMEFKELLYTIPTTYVKKNDFIYFKDVSISVLNTPYYDISDNALNNSSAVYKLHTGEVSVLCLGDLGIEGGERLLLETNPNLLRSDIVIMAHHGQNGVNQNVYKAIAPSIALWPTPYWLWTNNGGNGPYRTLETRNWMDELGCISYTTAFGDVILR